MDNKIETFAERYAAILTAYGLSPSDLAKKLNEPIAKFYKYAEGVKPRPALLQRMLVALPDLSEDFLFQGIGPIKGKRTLTPVARMPQLAESGDLDKIRIDIVKLSEQVARLSQEKDDLSNQLKKQEEQTERWQLAYLKLTQPGLFADQDPTERPVKLGASSWTTVKEVIRKQEQDFLEAADRETIGYKPSYLRQDAQARVLPMYPLYSPGRVAHL